MSEEHKPDRSCPTFKVRYESRAAARSFARRRAHAAGDRRQREYFCKRCQGWHLTSHDEAEHRRRRARRQRRATARRER